ncbi:hypothetical protein [Helicobacter pylori]|uniref:hypothetical protein n=1 Tax=Helicobacter pylori TaxID=210 RepID=UPI0013EF565D|nr:hypothetical protein [Helicobacter pylori]
MVRKIMPTSCKLQVANLLGSVLLESKRLTILGITQSMSSKRVFECVNLSLLNACLMVNP